MSVSTITSKGQITIPAAIRADMQLGPGDRIEFVKIAEGRYEVVAATQDVTVLKGLVATDRTVSIEEMDNAVRMRAPL